MKKIVFVSFVLILFLFFLLNANKADNRKSIVFWTLQLSNFKEYINNVVRDSKNDVMWVDIPYSEGEKRTLASILSDNPPDIINLTPDFSMLLAQKNTLYEIPAEYLSDYNLTESLKYDDKYYGIPFYATSSVTLFNKSLLPNLQKFPKTYEELLNIKPQKGTYTTMFSFSENDTLLKILNKYNINSPETINSEKSIELFKLFKNALDDGYIPIESATQTHRDALEKYMSGKLVFLVTGANFLNMIKENAPEVYRNTVILPQITGETSKYDSSLMNFVIPKKSKNKEKALQFVLFLTNKENQLEFSKLTSVLPVNKETLNDDYFKPQKTNNLQENARVISANQLNNMQTPLKNSKNKKDLNIISAHAIQEILINNKDIKETLDSFSEEWKKL